MLLHRSLRLVGYIRTGGTEVNSEEQKKMFEEFCQVNDYRLIGIADVDAEQPSHGLQNALQEVMQNDGLIALNLDRFVTHHADRLFDLRPLLDNLLHNGKVLITLLDGVDTTTADGQDRVLLLLNRWSEDESSMADTNLDAEGIKSSLDLQS